MIHRTRREFLSEVGRSMLVGSVGVATAVELGLAPTTAGDAESRVTFGKLEPLVSLMQETPPEALLPLLVERLEGGVSLKELAGAGALANVRAFAGQDYTGYHTFMALAPALHMANQLPQHHQPLPVLKVLYRNSSRIQVQEASHRDAIHAVQPWSGPASELDGPRLRDAVRKLDWDGAEAQFATMSQGPTGEAFNHLQYAVQDEVDVHRVVLSWRALAMLEIAGAEHAHTLLRQSVRYCLDVEQRMRDNGWTPSPIRELLPKLMDQYRLPETAFGMRKANDAWVEQLASTIYSGSRDAAADAVAQALAEGFELESIGEAISVAANLLVLNDPGRLEKYSTNEKPVGCVHGDSIGVHASDAANAWRNISRVGSARNRVSSLIVGAFHTAGQSSAFGGPPYDFSERMTEIHETEAEALLRISEEAIRSNDQARACAVVSRYGELALPARPVFDLMLRFACSEDGALHAEKFWQTAMEEFATTRQAFRWRQLVALARVTASEYGFAAPGYRQSRELLGIA